MHLLFERKHHKICHPEFISGYLANISHRNYERTLLSIMIKDSEISSEWQIAVLFSGFIIYLNNLPKILERL